MSSADQPADQRAVELAARAQAQQGHTYGVREVEGRRVLRCACGARTEPTDAGWAAMGEHVEKMAQVGVDQALAALGSVVHRG